LVGVVTGPVVVDGMRIVGDWGYAGVDEMGVDVAGEGVPEVGTPD